MIAVRRRDERLSPRQAIVAIYRPVRGWAPALGIALALDLLGAAVAVNGASLAASVENAQTAESLSEVLPIGVELSIDRLELGAEVELPRRYVARGFERIVFVAADAIGVSTRMLSTALSVLATDPLVVGRTESGGCFLVGVGGKEIGARNAVLSGLLGALAADGRLRSVSAPRLENLTRLTELAGIDELRAEVEPRASLVPRTVAIVQELDAS
jgi:hypothetical protein